MNSALLELIANILIALFVIKFIVTTIKQKSRSKNILTELNIVMIEGSQWGKGLSNGMEFFIKKERLGKKSYQYVILTKAKRAPDTILNYLISDPEVKSIFKEAPLSTIFRGGMKSLFPNVSEKILMLFAMGWPQKQWGKIAEDLDNIKGSYGKNIAIAPSEVAFAHHSPLISKNRAPNIIWATVSKAIASKETVEKILKKIKEANG